MKVSIAWIFDHIDADYHKIEVPDLLSKLNQITAEIEGYHKIDTQLDHFTLVTIQSITKEIHAFSAELQKKMSLPKRVDAQEDGCYLVITKDNDFRWATSIDLGGQKEMLLPALHIDEGKQKGGWKKSFETKDYIFEVDNKSITHRPDLWGHRGFAREVAAILDLHLKPLEDFCASINVIPHEDEAKANPECPYMLAIEDATLTHRFAGLYIPSITPTPSLLWMTTRLSRVDSRSIDAIVDCTNYVMLDTSQPMHAFDADRLRHQAVFARRARNKETLTLLDDQMIELTDQDIVIADGNRPISLAGIMGGKESGVHPTTNALFLESANFDAATIRRSSQRHKVRSEASARFEKSLDPNQNIMALQRFVQLIDQAGIASEIADEIVSLGKLIQCPIIEVSQQFIEDRLGTSIAPGFIRSTLEKLSYKVKEKHENNTLLYEVTVPTFRATKDGMIKEDIVEEVGRFFGYSEILPVLPQLETKPSPLHAIAQKYRIKQLLAYGLSMRELYTYAFFDESFLLEIDWDPGKTVQVKDPVSENWQRLITTLMPNMFKAVFENYNEYDELRFFEWARSWAQGEQINEKKVLTGIFYSKHTPLNFYDIKAQLHKLFIQIAVPVEWNPVQKIPYPWFNNSQTAYLEHEGQSLGVAGMVDQSFLKRFAEGSAFIFEFDAQRFEDYKKPFHRFQPLPKYPAVNRDISLIVPLSLSVQELTRIIAGFNEQIRSVVLIDMFQKKEWKQERALTFRYLIRSADKTLTKSEADAISKKVSSAVQHAGATVR